MRQRRRARRCRLPRSAREEQSCRGSALNPWPQALRLLSGLFPELFELFLEDCLEFRHLLQPRDHALRAFLESADTLFSVVQCAIDVVHGAKLLAPDDG